uniref:Uncharacterized protein n=1 Tax=uncultured bacterium pA1 TaxID=1776268 RepID=A0A0U3U6B8_9BACT|nr:hypothetical protein [uncultured bacterium pA1]
MCQTMKFNDLWPVNVGTSRLRIRTGRRSLALGLTFLPMAPMIHETPPVVNPLCGPRQGPDAGIRKTGPGRRAGRQASEAWSRLRYLRQMPR